MTGREVLWWLFAAMPGFGARALGIALLACGWPIAGAVYLVAGVAWPAMVAWFLWCEAPALAAELPSAEVRR